MPDDEDAREQDAPKNDEDAMVVPAKGARRRMRDAQSADARGSSWTRGALVFGLAAGAAAIAVLVLVGMQEGAIYAKPVDELMNQQAKFAGRQVRAEGNLVHGSLVKRDQPCEYRFTITKNGTELPVRFAQCVVPDTFRDVPGMDVGVTVEGSLASVGPGQPPFFEATTVLAKCPSKYEMKERQQKGEQMPHGPTAQQLP
jgi:cytochrome c-type biogenesis protein CcmE